MTQRRNYHPLTQYPIGRLPGLRPCRQWALAADGSITLEELAKASPAPTLGDFVGYRTSAGGLDWIPGGGNQFGMFSIDWDHYQKAGITSGVGVGAGFHFLSGPDQTDMPARTYDFSLSYQIRQRFGPVAFDACASVLAASDFEGSAREGILFPSHAVGYLHVDQVIDRSWASTFSTGATSSFFPWPEWSWCPGPRCAYELVFPRPRAVFQLADRYRFYLSGELGGGSWAIGRVQASTTWPPTAISASCVGLEFAEERRRAVGLRNRLLVRSPPGILVRHRRHESR